MLPRQLLLCLLCLTGSAALALSPLPRDVSAAGGGATQGLIGPSQSRIVVFSPADGALPGAASIFVNGSYHASLVKGVHSQLCHAPGRVELAVRQVRSGAASRPFDAQTTLDLAGGQTYYLQAQGERPQLQLVPAEQARAALAGTRLQSHTVSRVAQECIELIADPTPLKPAGAAARPAQP